MRLRGETRTFVLVAANAEGLAWSHQNWNQAILYPMNRANRYIDGRYGSDPKALDFISLRDGRYRRKTLRPHDGSLANTADALWGVDLNRNFTTDFEPGTCEVLEVFAGPTWASEPETRAIETFLISTFNRVDQPLLGLLDVHNNQQKIFVTDNVPGVDPMYDAHVARLAERISVRFGEGGIALADQSINEGFPGSLRRQVARAFRVPALTLELPFSRNVQTSFFVKDSETTGVYNGMRLAALSMIDWATGPPHVVMVEIEGPSVVYRARWQTTSESSRQLNVEVSAPATPGTYNVTVQFSRPAHAVGKGNTQPPAPLVRWGPVGNPEAKPVVGVRWTKTVWTNDTWIGTLDITLDDVLGAQGPLTGIPFQLRIPFSDPFGNQLDSDPSTVVKWDKKWVQYEPNETGGPDTNHLFFGSRE